MLNIHLQEDKNELKLKLNEKLFSDTFNENYFVQGYTELLQ